jgi:LacI family repressor for deo operon, udp, cdd, tsx, nupC, and nupG
VSIKDVARITGVSIATVSRCLNNPERVKENTRIRVQEAIRRTGYTPNTLAQSFRRGKTNTIMVVLPSVGDPFFTDVMKGIRNVADEKGYSLLINETRFNAMAADEVCAMVDSRQADGIVLLAPMSSFGTESLSSRNHSVIPIVVGCETISSEHSGFPLVHVDNVLAAREATDHLIANGHQQIAFMYGLNQSLLSKDREFGYRSAMQAAGLPIEENWVVEGKLTINGAIRATRKLLAHAYRPTAIFCANDEMAMGCYHEIRSSGLNIPDDISIIGFDDIRYAEVMNPSLTTIFQPAEEIGERLVYRLLTEIEQGPTQAAVAEIVPHKLIIRQSVSRRG